jgi:hypothetical protein
MKWRNIVRAVVCAAKSSHMQRLEAEVARLRVENRALLNSILGIAGVPPVMVAGSGAEDGAVGALPMIEVGNGVKPNGSVAGGVLAGADPGALGKGRRSTGKSNSGANAGASKMQLTPKRKRSWQQVTRTREINAIKKKPQDTDS